MSYKGYEVKKQKQVISSVIMKKSKKLFIKKGQPILGGKKQFIKKQRLILQSA